MIKADIKVHQLAKKLKITRPSLSRKLRYELSQNEKERVIKAIKEIRKEERN